MLKGRVQNVTCHIFIAMSHAAEYEQMHEILRLLQVNEAQLLTTWKMEYPSDFEPSSVLNLRAGLVDRCRFVRHSL